MSFDDIFNLVPGPVRYFLITVLLSLLIGLEQRYLHKEKSDKDKPLFGTDRTFTFIGILGHILYVLDNRYYLFMLGMASLVVFMAVYYYFKMKAADQYGLTTIFVALITYSIGPLIITQEPWLVLLIFVAVLLLVELKPAFAELSRDFGEEEFITLGKFLILAGVILPIVPDERLIEQISITPYQVWLAVVVVSTISYAGYLLQRFVFKKAGIFITAILGGLYSSTATTFILARKSRLSPDKPYTYASSVLFATCMMFPKMLILAFIFNPSLAGKLAVPLGILFLVSLAIGLYILSLRKKQTNLSIDKLQENPLELKIAAIFALLYILLNVATHYSVEFFGDVGLRVLSLVVGVTAIDPFLINLFQGEFKVDETILIQSTLFAVASNNIMKSIYAFVVGKGDMRKMSLIGLLIVAAINIVLVFFI